MQTDYLIIGSGIAGTLLCYELLQQKKSVLVIDDDAVFSASHVAGAILNPVNIKQWTAAKDYDHYISQALETYTGLQKILDAHVISEVPIIAFEEQSTNTSAEVNKYLSALSSEEAKIINHYFNSSLSQQKIFPSWQIHSNTLFAGWKQQLRSENLLLTERFDVSKITVSQHSVTYKNIQANKIIFCEGVSGAVNPFFPGLPFTKNRGEALLISIPDLPQNLIYHNSIRLIPAGDQMFWCGSNYSWNYSNLDPDMEWQKQTITQLQQWLKLPFKVEHHIVAERPTTAGQKPITFMHDSLPVAMFNGLGTKGFLMAPLLAKEFAEKIIAE